jgi:hypothetical protein
MPVVPCEATSNRAWASRRTKESHLRPVGFFCRSKGASIDFVNWLLGVRTVTLNHPLPQEPRCMCSCPQIWHVFLPDVQVGSLGHYTAIHTGKEPRPPAGRGSPQARTFLTAYRGARIASFQREPGATSLMASFNAIRVNRPFGQAPPASRRSQSPRHPYGHTKIVKSP